MIVDEHAQNTRKKKLVDLSMVNKVVKLEELLCLEVF